MRNDHTVNQYSLNFLRKRKLYGQRRTQKNISWRGFEKLVPIIFNQDHFSVRKYSRILGGHEREFLGGNLAL